MHSKLHIREYLIELAFVDMKWIPTQALRYWKYFIMYLKSNCCNAFYNKVSKSSPKCLYLKPAVLIQTKHAKQLLSMLVLLNPLRKSQPVQFSSLCLRCMPACT